MFGEELGVGHGTGLPVGEFTGLVTGLLVFRFILIHVDLLINRGGDSRDWSLAANKERQRMVTLETSGFLNVFYGKLKNIGFCV